MPVVPKPLIGASKPMLKPPSQSKHKGLPAQSRINAKDKARYAALQKQKV